MAENELNTIWLTREAHDKLVKELEYLTTEGRAEVTARIAQARDEGDLKENGGYHAAREEQGQREARIRVLEDMMRRAEVGESPDNPDEVAAGTEVTIAFGGDESDTETFLLGSREVLGLDSDATNVYSPQSPLGAAILGKTKGADVTYTAPNGKAIQVRILKVQTYQG